MLFPWKNPRSLFVFAPINDYSRLTVTSDSFIVVKGVQDILIIVLRSSKEICAFKTGGQKLELYFCTHDICVVSSRLHSNPMVKCLSFHFTGSTCET